MKNYVMLLLICLSVLSCESEQQQQKSLHSEGELEKSEIKSDENLCDENLLQEYLTFKKQCKNDYQNRLDIGECDKAFDSLKIKFINNFSCEAYNTNYGIPQILNESVLLSDKKSYEEQYYHGSEDQLRCGIYTEQEFRQYTFLCWTNDFTDIASAQKCLKVSKYIRERYPKLECEAKLEFYGALFNIFNVNSSYEKAEDYIKYHQ